MSPTARTAAAASLLLAGWAALASSTGLAQKRTVWDGVYTAAQADRGQKAFATSCGGCHRDDMSGGDDSEPPLRGQHFATKWEGQSVAALYDFIATNMPKSRPGTMELDMCVDVVAFILKSNGMPAGAAALTTNIDALDAITFTATKP